MVFSVFVRKIFEQNICLPLSKGNRFVFIHHYIRPDNDPIYLELCTTTYSVFVRQIDFIRQNFKIVDLDTLLNADLPPNQNYAALTFDDGFATIRSLVFPLLNRYEMPFTVFLNQFAVENNQLWVSNFLLQKDKSEYLEKIWEKLLKGKVYWEEFQKKPLEVLIEKGDWDENIIKILCHDPPPMNSLYLNKEDILFLAPKGVRFGNHTAEHLPLSYCSPTLQKQEIEKNQFFLENLLDQPIRHFAIPFGKKNHFNSTTAQICRDNYLTFIYTTNPNQLKTPFMPPFPDEESGISLIPRISFTEEKPKQVCFYINRTFFRTYDL